MPDSTTPRHAWTFFRTGGLDQVALLTGSDLLALDQLDPKLWVALACPVKGLELDERTLGLIDADGDGRIRPPELLAAVRWAAAHLRDASILLQGQDGLPLDALDAEKPAGRAVLTAARQILAAAGKTDAAIITVAEASSPETVFAGKALKGDGVVIPGASGEAGVDAVLEDVLRCTGGTRDARGRLGVTKQHVITFYSDLAASTAWETAGADPSVQVLGEATASAYAALATVRVKVDDYFARCRLAAFDPRATALLNRPETDYQAVVSKDLQASAPEAAGFPLARVEAGKPLPLLRGVNPAWIKAIDKLRVSAVIPILRGEVAELNEADWDGIKAKLAKYEAWMTSRPAASVSGVPAERRLEAARPERRAAVERVFARDGELAESFAAIAAVEKLARLHRDLRALLHNFINFADFFAKDRRAIFQAGTLYLDTRSTDLCVRVDAPSPLAASCRLYLAYCTCTRAGETPRLIAACFTQGDSDYLAVGRRGVFYDRRGRDWDATVTSLVDHPISVRQAFWAPYKKLVRFVEEQVAKRATAAEAGAADRMAGVAGKAVAGEAPRPPEPAKKFDLALITGIGVALGSIGGFLAAIFSNFVSLGLWMPAALAGLLLLISGPSMLIAWLKLRQRTLGPLLEVGGWAINGRVRINLPFGATLTQMARPPAGLGRGLRDPYEDPTGARWRRRLVVAAVLLALAVAVAFARWRGGKRGHPPRETAPAATARP